MKTQKREGATMKYPMLGSYSEGTMRTEDLLPNCVAILDEYDAGWRDRLIPDDLALLDGLEGALDWPEEEQLNAQLDDLLIETLWSKVEELAPPYCYWGSHEGDGASYGFWVAWDAVEDAVAFGELKKVSDLSEVTDKDQEVLLVNDHGNATLYQRTELKEVWVLRRGSFC